jgi:putative restriction endonuclease
MSVNHVERAFRAWPILTKRARDRDTITYGELAGLLGIHRRPIRYLLGVIQDYCIEANLPPLTILIINQSGKPGSGFIAYDFDNLEQGREWVWDFNWNSIENPFAFAADGESYDTLVNKLVNDPDNSGDVYRRVKARGVRQVIFRDALLKAYGRKCGFTGISFYATLEAAHIIPWGQCDASERMDVRNGILLNSLHHKLFDNSYITVNHDYRIIYSDPTAEDGVYSDFDKLISSNLHGKKMVLPFKVNNRPSISYLERHHRIHEWREAELIVR